MKELEQTKQQKVEVCKIRANLDRDYLVGFDRKMIGMLKKIEDFAANLKKFEPDQKHWNPKWNVYQQKNMNFEFLEESQTITDFQKFVKFNFGV